MQSIMGREFKSQILLNAILHNTQLENENKDDKNISGKLKMLHIQDMIQMHVGAGGGSFVFVYVWKNGNVMIHIIHSERIQSKLNLQKGFFLLKDSYFSVSFQSIFQLNRGAESVEHLSVCFMC